MLKLNYLSIWIYLKLFEMNIYFQLFMMIMIDVKCNTPFSQQCK